MKRLSGTKTYVSMIAWLALLSFSLISCSTNRDRSLSEINEGSDINSSSAIGQLKTATAPANPDLRGNNFDIVLIQTEEETFSPLLDTIEAGIEDGIRQLNSSGGINGARINLTRKSFPPDPGDIAGEISDYIYQAEPILIFFAYPLNESLIAELNNIDVPILSFGIGNEVTARSTAKSENFFWLVPPPDTQIAFFLSEVWKHWDQLRPAGIFNQMASGVISSDIEGDQISLYPALSPFLEERNLNFSL